MAIFHWQLFWKKWHLHVTKTREALEFGVIRYDEVCLWVVVGPLQMRWSWLESMKIGDVPDEEIFICFNCGCNHSGLYHQLYCSLLCEQLDK